MTFIQIIEYKTGRIDELNAAMDEWLAATEGTRTAIRGTQAHDRDQPGTYSTLSSSPRTRPRWRIRTSPRPANLPLALPLYATVLRRSGTWT